MISIYREEIRDLLNKKMKKEAEDIWLQLIEGDPLDYELFIGLSFEFEKKGLEKEAVLLLNMVIPHLIAAEKKDHAVSVIKRTAELTPHDRETAQTIMEFYKEIYEGFPNLEKIIEVSGINNITADIVSSIQLIENMTVFKNNDFCKHHSWGIGKIKNINYDDKIVTIDFYTKKDHKMDINLAVKALEKIDDSHISAMKYKNMARLKDLAEDDPVELIKIVLRSFDDNKAKMEDIIDLLSPDVVPVDNWKKWWDKTKKMLKSDPYISIPEKKEKYFSLVDAPVTLDEKILKSYFSITTPKEKLNFISARLKKQGKDVFGIRIYKEISDDVAKIIQSNYPLNSWLSLEAYYTLSVISSAYPEALSHSKITLKNIFDSIENISAAISGMEKIEFQKQAIKDLADIYKDKWIDIYFELLSVAPVELIDDIIEPLMKNTDNLPKLKQIFKISYDLIGESEDILLWIAKNIHESNHKVLLEEFANISLFEKLIDLLDLHYAGVIDKNEKISSKINDLIFKNSCEFVSGLLKQSSEDQKIHVAKTISDCCSLDKLSKQTLIAKFIINCPKVKEIIKSEESKSTAIYSSHKGYEAKQAEFYHLVNVLIPKNAQAINIARSYGDLRENFEYKSAKEEQARLLRQKGELENLFNKIKIIEYDAIDNKQVSIATKVHLNDLNKNTEKCYTIMGIWDSEPEKGVISYLTPIAQGLIGKKVGDEIEFLTGTESHRYKILKIEKVSEN